MHVGVGKGIGMGFFATPLAHLIPGGHLDGQHHHLRQKLVDRAPQTVAVAPDERLSRMGARGNRAEMDEWGGGVGALNDRAEQVGQAVPKRSAPDDVHVDRFEDLDPPEDDPSINLHTGKRGLRENASYVALSLWGRHW